MEHGHLRAETVTPFLTASDPALKRTAAWIIGRHPEWGETLAGYLRDRIHAKNETAADQEELTGLLARFAATRAVQDLLAEGLMNDSNSLTTRRIAIRAMARAGLKTAPDRWLEAINAVLSGNNRELVAEAVAAARNLRPAKGQAETLAAGLLRIAENAREDEGLRLRALAAAPDGLNRVDPTLFTFLLAHLSPERPVAERGAAADVLSHAKLNSEQLQDLAKALKSVGPMELDRLLEPFVHSTDAGVGHALLESLKSADARASLRVDAVQQRLAKYPIEIRKEAEQLYALLDVDREKQRAHLDKLLGSIKSGDVRRGQAVFHSTKAACFSCHAVGYRGGTIGPDLTRIGAIRSERDLLESIVYPSASFVRGYEPVLVATKDGRTHNGLIKKDAPDEIHLVIAADKEERIPRTDIEAIEPSKVSVMPAGLEQQLTVQDLADLVAFLKACK
jgi:putative heme-binding domain-containing protein